MSSVSTPFPALTLSQRALFSFGCISTAVFLGLLFKKVLSSRKAAGYQLVDSENAAAPKNDTQENTGFHFFKFISAFFLILLQIYLCETHIVSDQPRTYSRDAYFFIICICLGVSLLQVQKIPKRGTAPVPLLFRSQTEEWRGWMQTMFVLYHVYAAAEVYKVIRVFVACYVWMTGFGNFSYFKKTADFTMDRLLNTLWRLNVLVILICVAANTPYILYYIVPLHTVFFFYVLVFFVVGKRWNGTERGLQVKLVIMSVCTFILFDIPGVFDSIFSVVLFAIDSATRHEFHFRMSLDHYATLFGMVMAFNFKQSQSDLDTVEGLSTGRKWAVRVFVMLGLGSLAMTWTTVYLNNDKVAYNSYHPYLFIFPLLLYVFARNCSAWLRERYLWLFSWIGKITLETYLCQLHILMKNSATRLIDFIPGYPLLNMGLIMMPYLFAAHSLFHLTSHLRPFVLPGSMQTTVRNFATALLVGGILTVAVMPFNETSFVVAMATAFVVTFVVVFVVAATNQGERLSGVAAMWSSLAGDVTTGDSTPAAEASAESVQASGFKERLSKYWKVAVFVVVSALVGSGLIALSHSSSAGIPAASCKVAASIGSWSEAADSTKTWTFSTESVTSCGVHEFSRDSAELMLSRAVSPSASGRRKIVFLGDEATFSLFGSVGGILDVDSSILSAYPTSWVEGALGAKTKADLVFVPSPSIFRSIESVVSIFSPQQLVNGSVIPSDLGLQNDTTHLLFVVSPTRADGESAPELSPTRLSAYRGMLHLLPTFVTVAVAAPSTSGQPLAMAALLHGLKGEPHVVYLDTAMVSSAGTSGVENGPILGQVLLNNVEQHIQYTMRENKRANVHVRPELAAAIVAVIVFLVFSRDNFFFLRLALFIDSKLFAKNRVVVGDEPGNDP